MKRAEFHVCLPYAVQVDGVVLEGVVLQRHDLLDEHVLRGLDGVLCRPAGQLGHVQDDLEEDLDAAGAKTVD